MYHSYKQKIPSVSKEREILETAINRYMTTMQDTTGQEDKYIIQMTKRDVMIYVKNFSNLED